MYYNPQSSKIIPYNIYYHTVFHYGSIPQDPGASFFVFFPVLPKNSIHIVVQPGHDMGTERTAISPEVVGTSGELIKGANHYEQQ